MSSTIRVGDSGKIFKIHAYCEEPDIIICGNKADLENRRQVSTARARQLAEQLGLPYFETSACTSANVEKSVECLLDLVMQRIIRTRDLDNNEEDCRGVVLEQDAVETAQRTCQSC
ncbi:unnamed protein product [Enterobius vermicularis]|uniref:Small monomeric GTPase n=1 Tax=Enterobius vermicularis TaxID=51028 RepID=A0A0N4VK97_ENTVE|nr:unnamed protein product [Enterobius vermicularis]